MARPVSRRARRVPRRGALLAGVAALLTAAAGLTGCSSGGTSSASNAETSSGTMSSAHRAAVKDAVTDAMHLSGAPGALVGVYTSWAGDYQAGVGTTKRGGKAPVTTNMAWRVGSVTKPMTCTVLLSLVQQGKVKLNDPVTKFLPRLVGVGGITLGQLCQNTSGLGDYIGSLLPQFVDNPTRTYAQLELMADGMGSATAAAPGQAWSYSNAGYILLGMALQAATGQTWQQLYQNDVFGPLGMSSTSLPSGNTIPGADGLHGYATPLDEDTGAAQCGSVADVTTMSPSGLWTSSGVVSTLGDLKTFAQSFASSSLLSGTAKKDAWKTVVLGTDSPSWQTYGMGGLQLGPMRGQDGMAPGFITSVLSDPTSGLTVVVMLNDSTSGAAYAQALAMKVAAIAADFPAQKGKKAPKIALPWTTDTADQSMLYLATCRPAGQPAQAAAPVAGQYLPLPAS
jgi:D-alanyl-D-alanine carboxypeptidase